jgi:hypothetical protein
VNNYNGFGLSRAHQLSMYDVNLSTARSAAIGGAFVSLGADLSSLYINPAGLGMYRSSDFSVTLGPSVSRVTNSMLGEQSVSATRTAFTVNNFGAAFNLYEGTGATTSFTLGIGYSRLADYNYRSHMKIASGSGSILDVFEMQDANGSVANNTPDSWGAYLAGELNLLPAANVVAGDAQIVKNMDELSRGSAGEYTVGAGWNFNNKVYIGFSLGIVDIYQKREMTYSEDYSSNNATDPLRYMDYTQYLKSVGTGFNIKTGVVYRPIPDLRIGLAFHSPTVATVHEYADYNMLVGYADGYEYEAFSNITEEYREDFYTPARLMTGVSYTFFDTGILAIDYERTFYNGIGVYGDELYTQAQRIRFRDDVKYSFTGSDALRVGAEVMATDYLALRFGYGCTRDGLKKRTIDNPIGLDLPVRRESSVFSAGLGMNIGPMTKLDVTYSFLTAKMTDYDMFYYFDNFGDNDASNDVELFPGANATDRTSQKIERHNVMLSLSYRF